MVVAGGLDSFARYRHWLTIDGIGLVAYTNDKEPPDAQTVRRYLTGVTDRTAYVTVDGIEDALAQIAAWPGYKTGDGTEARRGIRINPEYPILELPICGHLAQNRKGEYICGEESDISADVESEWFPGIYGKCFVEGDDPTPPRCFVQEYLRAHPGLDRSLDMKKWKPTRYVELNGAKFPIVTYKVVPA